jgi:hypothetical protein
VLTVHCITTQQLQAWRAFIENVQRPLVHAQLWRDATKKSLGQLLRRLGLLQIHLQERGVGFDPALALKLTSLQLQRGDGARQVAGFVAKVGVRDLTVQLAGCQLVNRRAYAVQRHTDGVADQPGQQQGQRRTAQQQHISDLAAALRILGQILRRIVDVGFLVFLYLDEQTVAFLLQREKFVTVEQRQGLPEGALAGQLQRFIAVFLQALQYHLELQQAGQAALSPQRWTNLLQGLVQTLLGDVHLGPGADADVRVAGSDRALQCQQQMRQLHPNLLHMLDTDQILLVQLLHFVPERILGAQALHAQHQDQYQ